MPRNEWYRTCQNTRSLPAAHLDPAAPEEGHAILCRVRVSGRGGAGPAPEHHEASHGALASARLQRGGKKNTSITTKAWRHLPWTFEEAPRLGARAAREHLNGGKEEPPEETDVILHDDDDDDAEDPENTGNAVELFSGRCRTEGAPASCR